MPRYLVVQLRRNFFLFFFKLFNCQFKARRLGGIVAVFEISLDVVSDLLDERVALHERVVSGLGCHFDSEVLNLSLCQVNHALESPFHGLIRLEVRPDQLVWLPEERSVKLSGQGVGVDVGGNG